MKPRCGGFWVYRRYGLNSWFFLCLAGADTGIFSPVNLGSAIIKPDLPRRNFPCHSRSGQPPCCATAGGVRALTPFPPISKSAKPADLKPEIRGLRHSSLWTPHGAESTRRACPMRPERSVNPATTGRISSIPPKLPAPGFPKNAMTPAQPDLLGSWMPECIECGSGWRWKLADGRQRGRSCRHRRRAGRLRQVSRSRPDNRSRTGRVRRVVWGREAVCRQRFSLQAPARRGTFSRLIRLAITSQ